MATNPTARIALDQAVLAALKRVQGEDPAGPYAVQVTELRRAMMTGRPLTEPTPSGVELGHVTAALTRAVVLRAALEATNRLLEHQPGDIVLVMRKAKITQELTALPSSEHV